MLGPLERQVATRTLQKKEEARCSLIEKEYRIKLFARAYRTPLK